jgi:hypothetical protein
MRVKIKVGKLKSELCKGTEEVRFSLKERPSFILLEVTYGTDKDDILVGRILFSYREVRDNDYRTVLYV